MSKYAFFENISSGVVFSDPLYGEDVWCQYRKAFTDKNWYMQLDCKKEPHYGFLDFKIVFGRPTLVGNTRFEETPDSISTYTPKHYALKSVELGIDSAHIFCGSMKDFKEFGESIAISTGGDGMFGELYELTLRGDEKPVGYVLFCSFDPTFMSENDFFKHLLSSFEGKEISREDFEYGVSPKNLKNRLLLSSELASLQEKKGKGSPDKDLGL